MKKYIIFLLAFFSAFSAQHSAFAQDSTKGKLVRTREIISDTGKVPVIIDGHGNYRWQSVSGGGGGGFVWIDTTNNNWIAPPNINGSPSGGYNTKAGIGSLSSVTSGSENTAIGEEALYSITDNNSNTAVGRRSLYTLQSGGNDNVAIGNNALRMLSVGTQNVAVGSYAGNNSSGSATYNSDIFLGDAAGYFSPSDLQNAFEAGSYQAPIYGVYFGGGYRMNDGEQPGVDYTIHGTGAGLGGTDQNGGSVTIAGGISTGAGHGGSIIFSSSPYGESGTSDNALTELLSINDSGVVKFTYNHGSPGQVLTTDGTGVTSWTDITMLLPDTTGKTGYTLRVKAGGGLEWVAPLFIHYFTGYRDQSPAWNRKFESVEIYQEILY